MNNIERELWTLNDIHIYQLWKQSRLPMTKFLKEYRNQIDNHIKRVLYNE